VDTDLTDTRDMLVVHTALLRETRLAPDLVRRAAGADARRVRTVADHVELVLHLVHEHHAGEDRLLWPLVRERVRTAEALDRADEQHGAIGAAVDRATAAIPAWRAGPTRAAPLADALEALHALLVEHLDDEERHLLPLAAACLTPAEWGAVGEAAMAATPKRHLPLLLGLLMYEGDPAVIAAMLHGAPAPVRLAIGFLGPRAFARYSRRVHGTPTP
jgi:hemerythrin-like domain-containing protein